MSRWLISGACALLAALCACTGPRPSTLPHGAAAYEAIPAPQVASEPTPRSLRAGDAITVNIYREPELSAERLTIDDSGRIQLPLVGEVDAAGRTPAQLSGLLAERYGARYLRNPRVTVQLVTPAVQEISVEGEVNAPGVYPVTRDETLLSALARAKSPTPNARRNEVVVFRTINGQRMGAVFDVDQIRAGKAADPQILEGDVVVVGLSQLRGAFRDFLQATPLLFAFTAF